MGDFENEEEGWRCYATYTPRDFFQMLKEQYRKLEDVRSRSSLEDVMSYHVVPEQPTPMSLIGSSRNDSKQWRY